MAHIVQYACAPDALTHKRAQANGKTVEDAGVAGRNLVTPEGYIVSTIKVGTNTVSRVLDPPAFIAWDRTSGTELAAGNYWSITRLGDRALFKPNSTVEVNYDTVAATTYKQPTGHKYVGIDVALQRNPSGLTGVRGIGNVDQTVAASSLVTLYRDDSDNEYNSLIVMLTDWSSATNLSDTVLAESENTVVLAIPGEVVRGVTSGYDLYGSAGFGLRGVSVYTETYLNEAEESVQAVYVLANVYKGKYCEPTDDEFGVYFAARIDLVEGRPQTFIWARRIDMAFGATYATNAISIWADGEPSLLRAALCTAWAGAEQTSFNEVVTMDKATGATLGMADGPCHGTCSLALFSRFAAGCMWGAQYVFDGYLDGMVTSVRLFRQRGDATVYSSIPGYNVGHGMQPGVSIATSKNAAAANLVVELGGGQVGVLVVPSGTYSLSASLPFYMAVLDLETLALVRVSALIGSATMHAVYGGYTHELSVVTPQVLDGTGAVTTPAVLMAVLGRELYLSNDGGDTWRDIGPGVLGTPLYRGNRLHSVILGKTL